MSTFPAGRVDDPSDNQDRDTDFSARPRPTGYGVFLKIHAPGVGMRLEVHAGPTPNANQVDEGPELDGGR